MEVDTAGPSTTNGDASVMAPAGSGGAAAGAQVGDLSCYVCMSFLRLLFALSMGDGNSLLRRLNN